ncbi:MAG: NAD(P)/FAD-dependent oxidoreductase [Phycisphaerales bacterium]
MTNGSDRKTSHDPGSRDAGVPSLSVDAVIIGGGIAGLWTLWALRRAGLAALLVERTALGDGQTIGSQGIIHGGVKYALTGSASRASLAIAAMPQRWADALSPRDLSTRRDDPAIATPDLSDVRVLSRSQLLWTTTGTLSRLAGLAASRALRTPVRALAVGSRPDAFVDAPSNVGVYEVDETVIDPASLMASLARAAQRAGGTDEHSIVPALLMGNAQIIADGPLQVAITSPGGGDRLTLAARAVVMCAGEGNAPMLAALGLASRAPSQVRPLHMVMARAAKLPMIFGHCIAGSLSDKPRITITSQRDDAGRVVWNIGGLPAERGVSMSPADLIAHVRDELRACLPWVDLTQAEFATTRWVRAEGLTADGTRPDEPVITRVPVAGGEVIAAWPTKLAFAPLVADKVLAMHADLPRAAAASESMVSPDLSSWPVPRPAVLPWLDQNVRWTAPTHRAAGARS